MTEEEIRDLRKETLEKQQRLERAQGLQAKIEHVSTTKQHLERRCFDTTCLLGIFSSDPGDLLSTAHDVDKWYRRRLWEQVRRAYLEELALVIAELERELAAM